MKLASFDEPQGEASNRAETVEEEDVTLVDADMETVAASVGMTLSRRARDETRQDTGELDKMFRFARSRGANGRVVVYQDSKTGRVVVEPCTEPEVEQAIQGHLIGCKLMQEGATTASYRLVATQDLPIDTVIGADTGILRTENEFQARQSGATSLMQQLYCIDIPESLLRGFQYKGPNLVMDCTEFGNELLHANDAFWACQDYAVPPNIGSFVVLDPPNEMLYTVYYTLKDVAKGEQLLISYGEETWESICNIMLTTQAENSMWYDRYEALLEGAMVSSFADEGLRPEQAAARAAEQIGTDLKEDSARLRQLTIYMDCDNRGQTGICDYVFEGQRRDDGYSWNGECSETCSVLRNKNFPGLSETEAFRQVTEDEAFQAAGCERLSGKDLLLTDALPRAVLAAYKQLGEKGMRGQKGIKIVDPLDPSTADTYRLLQGGKSKTYPAEVLYRFRTNQLTIDIQVFGCVFCFLQIVSSTFSDLVIKYHSARMLTPPGHRAFALMAAAPLKKGEPIEVYAGQLRTEINLDGMPHGTDHYAYDIDAAAFDVFGTQIEGEGDSSDEDEDEEADENKGRVTQVLVENRWRGNKSRFVNDCWQREGGEARHLNCVAEQVWDVERSLPCVVFFATRDIKRHEEIVTDYGKRYWRVVWKHLSRAHMEYWVQASPRVHAMEQALMERKEDLPEKPPPMPPVIYQEAKGATSY
eukprot:gene3205-4051_t